VSTYTFDDKDIASKWIMGLMPISITIVRKIVLKNEKIFRLVVVDILFCFGIAKESAVVLLLNPLTS